MIHNWLIVVPKNVRARHELSDIVRTQVVPKVNIRPDAVCFQEVAGWANVFSFSGNSALFGYDVPYCLDDQGAVIVSGLPTFEQYPSATDRDLTRCMRHAFFNKTPDEMFSTIGGDWQAAFCAERKVTALYSFSGYYSLCYQDSADFFAVSNRAVLAAPFGAIGTTVRYNKDVLSWVYSTTMILGQQTPYAGVHKLRPGNYLEYQREGGLSISSYRENFYTPLEFAATTEREEYFQETVAGLIKRVAWYFDRGLPLQAHLTGGKDSRALLSLLVASGALEKLGFVQTFGDDDNGDVMVARAVMKHLGLAERHRVTTGMKVATIPVHGDLIGRFCYSSPYYDGHLTAYDGTKPGGRAYSEAITFMGGGGEIYRQKHHRNFSDLALVKKHFTDWSYKYDRLGLLSRATREWQLEQLEQECALLLREQIRNQHSKFYIDQRLSNWGAAHYQNNQSGSIAALNDIRLARLALSADNIGEDIHFYIMKTACPSILTVPFLNQAWTDGTAELAKAAGCFLDPINVASSHNYPWQYDIYRKYRPALARFILRHQQLFEGRIAERGLRRLIYLPDEQVTSDAIKMLFGAVGHVFWLGGLDTAAKSWQSSGLAIRIAGNCAAQYANVNWDLPSQNDSEHPLVRELAKDLGRADLNDRLMQNSIYRKFQRKLRSHIARRYA